MTNYLQQELNPLAQLFNHLAPISNCSKNDCSGVSIGETDESVFVEVPLPGVSKDKIQLTYEKGSLLVKGEEAEEKEEVKYHLKSSRKFAYRIAIPTRIDEQASPEANYRDGILRVQFPKSRLARPMKIDIK